jgi:hypothetical protein
MSVLYLITACLVPPGKKFEPTMDYSRNYTEIYGSSRRKKSCNGGDGARTKSILQRPTKYSAFLSRSPMDSEVLLKEAGPSFDYTEQRDTADSSNRDDDSSRDPDWSLREACSIRDEGSFV